MKDIRIDADGNQRCWNCGNKNFTQKRTFRSKAASVTAAVTVVGLPAAAATLATKKKLQCQACGEYNDVGSAKPWDAPADTKLAERKGTWRENAGAGAGSPLETAKAMELSKKAPKSYAVAADSVAESMRGATEVGGDRILFDGEDLIVTFGRMSRAGGNPAAVLVPVSEIVRTVFMKSQLRAQFRSGEILMIGAAFKGGPALEALSKAINQAIADEEASAAQAEAAAAAELEAVVTAPAAVPTGDDVITQIARLDELRKAGILTDEEFVAKKSVLLERL